MKSKAEKEKIKIDMSNGEKLPILNIKPSKKTQPMPQDSEIQEQKIPKLPDLPELPQEIITHYKEDLNKELPTTNELNIKNLEKEIKEKKRLLKLKREEEKLRLAKEELERIKAEKQEKIEKEIEIPKEDESIKLISELKEEFIKTCPLCNHKLKRSKVKREGFILKQHIKCKNKSCNFAKEIIFKI
jgi:hypothetical protein